MTSIPTDFSRHGPCQIVECLSAFAYHCCWRWKNWVSPLLKTSHALVFFLLLDLGFLVLHFFYLGDILGNRFSIEDDHGFAEFYQHMKELALAELLLVFLIESDDLLFLAWTGLFAYFFIDDSFQFHETVGLWLSERLNFSAAIGLRARDFGELLVTGFATLSFVAVLLMTYRHGQHESRRITRVLLSMLLILAFFGVVVDMVHILFLEVPLGSAFGVVEDGGEMLVMSLILWYVVKQFLFRDAMVTSSVTSNQRDTSMTG